jgi:PhoPQ-activated pathogenicity-related protein
MTLLQNLRTLLPNLSIPQGYGPNRFILGGHSKRAPAVWIASAIDDRVIGTLSGGFAPDLADDFVRREAEGDDLDSISPPSLNSLINRRLFSVDFTFTIQDWLEFLVSSDGEHYRNRFSLTRFVDSVKGSFLLTNGVHDPNVSLGVFDDFYEENRGQKEMVLSYIPNYQHGIGNDRHPINWQALIAHVLYGRNIPTSITAQGQVGGSSLTVTAQVTTQSQVVEASLWYAEDSDKQLDGVAFTKAAMTEVSAGNYETTVTLNGSPELRYFIEVHDRDTAQSLTTDGHFTSVIYSNP